MSTDLTARDLWPLVQKLPHDEQVRLAMLALKAAAEVADDVSAYRVAPPTADEFGSDEDPLAWDGEGWEEFSASR